MKIAVYAIALNEEQFVERFCQSAKEADLILIADTGSSDDTIGKAVAQGAETRSICISPWRFDDARNAALALLPGDIDVCVSLDLDEILQPGWREEIERVWELGVTTRLHYLFDWRGDGHSPFIYEKIHARKGYRWVHPCHERPVAYGIEENIAATDKLLVVHKADPAKSRAQYLPLLEMSVKEDPNDPRNAFYYARELSFYGHWQKAIDECNRYLALPGADWPNERCYAYRVMARAYDALGDQQGALRAAHLGVVEAPLTREPWHELAKMAYVAGRWGECLGAALEGLKITERQKIYTVDPEVWGAPLHDYASIAAWNLGMVETAVEHIEKALTFEPGNERFKTNLGWYKQSLEQA